MSTKLFDDNVRLLGNVAGYHIDRHSLLTSNLANIDTPHYKAKDASFEKALQSALPDPNALRMVRTDPGHMPTYDASGQVKPEVQTTGEVNLDKEMAKLAENNLRYSAVLQILGGKYRALKQAIEQGGR